ncbi:MAG: HTTM domain-containing protein [Bacteroidota bacterium]
MLLIRHTEKFLFKPVNSAPLVIFRIIFGALMLFGSLRFISKGWVSELYIDPQFHFTYLGFDWVQPLPGSWMYAPFIGMVFAALGILLGAFYRFSALLFFILFTYVELLDKTYYLNHYYFVSLIAFLMIFLPANAALSVDARRNPKISDLKVPNWTIWIIRFQLGIVYFYAGMAKINPDWLLEAQPLKTWLQAYRDLPVAGPWFASSFLAFAFSWFGCIYDLTIPFFLSRDKTRTWAYAVLVIFHIATWLLFPIGVFPWVMIFSALIFFPANFHAELIRLIRSLLNLKESLVERTRRKSLRLVKYLLAAYILAQLLVPLRFLLYPGPVFWSEEGFRFSWRVMLIHKEGMATFYVKDRKTGGEIEIDNKQFLTESQEDQMATQPDFILQYAAYLHKSFRDTVLNFSGKKVHLKDPEVHAESYVSLNGRPSQKFLDKKHDLTQIHYNFAARKWLEPYQ